MIWESVKISGPQVGYKPSKVSVHSMRAGCTMELLPTRVDTNKITLVRRWIRNFMLQYLHMYAQTFTEGMAARIVEHGEYLIVTTAHEG